MDWLGVKAKVKVGPHREQCQPFVRALFSLASWFLLLSALSLLAFLLRASLFRSSRFPSLLPWRNFLPPICLSSVIVADGIASRFGCVRTFYKYTATKKYFIFKARYIYSGNGQENNIIFRVICIFKFLCVRYTRTRIDIYFWNFR